MRKPLLLLVPVVAVVAFAGSVSAQTRHSPLVGCWEFTSDRAALSPTSGGGFGTLPRGVVFVDSLLFSREGDPTYHMRAFARGDSARHWSSRRLVGTWHPHTDSVFAEFMNRRGQSGVGLRFRILGDSLNGKARPFTRRTRWEADVPVSAHRVTCGTGERG